MSAIATPAIDPVWEESIYSQGHHLNLYPFDGVVSFVFRWRPRDRPKSGVRLLEVGCGAGNNLWFAAREGFQVAGIDGSPSAIGFAGGRLAREGLPGDLRVGGFTELPWEDNAFDLAVDRCSLTCTGQAAQIEAVAELHRVLRPGGVFFYNGYSDRHTSARAGTRQADGRLDGITDGTLTGVGGLHFSSRLEVEALFARGWEILKFEHLDIDDLAAGREQKHAEWRVVARKL